MRNRDNRDWFESWYRMTFLPRCWSKPRREERESLVTHRLAVLLYKLDVRIKC